MTGVREEINHLKAELKYSEDKVARLSSKTMALEKDRNEWRKALCDFYFGYIVGTKEGELILKKLREAGVVGGKPEPEVGERIKWDDERETLMAVIKDRDREIKKLKEAGIEAGKEEE